MLNRTNLEHILSLDFEDIHWRTQDSTLASILFYKISEGSKSEDDFRQRIEKANFKYLILNKNIEGLNSNVYFLPEEQWPLVQFEILNRLYPLPPLKIIGVTGTNGKTTTADLVLQLGKKIGKKGISIGTLGVREPGSTILDFGLTSPPLIDLRKYLYQYGRDKDFCVLEASSHALDQNRVFGLVFDGAGWLSFSQDHLDYHHTMEDYFQAKLKIFDHLKSGVDLVVPAGQEELFQKIKKIKSSVIKSRSIEHSLPLFFEVKFNRENLEVAQAIVETVFKVKVPVIYEELIPPDGRFYVKKINEKLIVVDFAHTPDALENISVGIKKAFPSFDLKILFGCGGDRDRKKRPLMGEVASKYAKKIYLTSDNPRSENPEQIIEDIALGLTHVEFEKITNRRDAVKKAISELKDHQVLLLAGKGHENYILANGIKEPYSDIEEVEKNIQDKK